MLTLTQLQAATASVLNLEALARAQLQARKDARLTVPLPTQTPALTLGLTAAGAAAGAGAGEGDEEEGEGEGEAVSLGGVHLLRELRLAHDDLRWRISQRNAALTACSVVLADTQTACLEAQRRIVETKAAVAEVRKRTGISRR